MKQVTLTWSELSLAAAVGIRRHIVSLRRHSRQRAGVIQGPEAWTRDIEAAGAEMATAKALGLYWDAGVDTFDANDVGGSVGGLQVRHTPDRTNRTNRLIIRPKDADDALFVLVVGTAPDYTVVGWISGADAKQAQYLMAPNGREAAWFVPQDDLSPLDLLPLT